MMVPTRRRASLTDTEFPGPLHRFWAARSAPPPRSVDVGLLDLLPSSARVSDIGLGRSSKAWPPCTGPLIAAVEDAPAELDAVLRSRSCPPGGPVVPSRDVGKKLRKFCRGGLAASTFTGLAVLRAAAEPRDQRVPVQHERLVASCPDPGRGIDGDAIPVLSAMRERLTRSAPMRLTRALATSTSARVTSNRGRVPPRRTLRAQFIGRSTAWALTRPAGSRAAGCSTTASRPAR